jgi:DNA-binding CsgD family transcriptional regulator
MGECAVGSHHTKSAGNSPSQTFPPALPKVATDVTLDGTWVVLCDWHGRLVWKSAPGERLAIGDTLWKNASKRSMESVQSAVAGVATLRQQCMIEADNERGEHFRLWMWPLNDPDIAVCVLAMLIPGEISRLTDRERACMNCLAQGMTTRDIADELEIGLTTVHTHLRRSREKLGLTSGEALIGFAARYFFNPKPCEQDGAAEKRKRSG